MIDWCKSCLYDRYDGAEEPCINCDAVGGNRPSEYYPKKHPKPVTNYDRIVDKTPEELAEWIETIANCDSCQYSWSLGKCRGGDGTSHATCRLKWLEWLQQEA